MNKAQLIDHIADMTSESKAVVERVLNAFNETLKAVLSKGEEVTWIGHGTYKTSKRAARTGRNPQTGATINIPASIAVGFKVGKALKDAVN
jgi:DNA-binding protein HU-beta